ncbi:hypothetical protein [Crossiella equi]|uniref:hypothetical protein n=1 Tax=Crossiella equi TaxID=130796 RepID=UPI000A366A3F|nr:hypothetical protein [Crossiella equi]
MRVSPSRGGEGQPPKLSLVTDDRPPTRTEDGTLCEECTAGLHWVEFDQMKTAMAALMSGICRCPVCDCGEVLVAVVASVVPKAVLDRAARVDPTDMAALWDLTAKLLGLPTDSDFPCPPEDSGDES